MPSAHGRALCLGAASGQEVAVAGTYADFGRESEGRVVANLRHLRRSKMVDLEVRRLGAQRWNRRR